MHFKPPYLHSEFKFKASLSGGKGGQHVNKVATKVQLSFNIEGSKLLDQTEKQILSACLASALTDDGEFQLTVQSERSQLANKNLAIKKLYLTFNRCFVARKKRKASKPTAASVQKRLQNKKLHSMRKQNRRPSLE